MTIQESNTSASGEPSNELQLTEKQAQMALHIGAEYQANLSTITIGEARQSLAYDVFGVERWTQLTTAQRAVALTLFNQGRDREKQYQL